MGKNVVTKDISAHTIEYKMIRPSLKGSKMYPYATKRPISSYIYFQIIVREEFIEKHSNFSNRELFTAMSMAFKQLTDSERKPYDDMGRKDKETNEHDKVIHAKEKKRINDSIDLNENYLDVQKKEKSAFIYYQMGVRPMYANKYPNLNSRQLIAFMSLAFKFLSDNEKKRYHEQARKDEECYKREKNIGQCRFIYGTPLILIRNKVFKTNLDKRKDH